MNSKIFEDCIALNIQVEQLKRENKTLQKHIDIMEDKERGFYRELKSKDKLIYQNKKNYDQLMGMMVNNYRTHNELTDQIRIDNLISSFLYFMEHALGTKYLSWDKEELNSMAYVSLPDNKIPTIKEIKKAGITCVGLTNLLLHWCNLPIPGQGLDWCGGTYQYFKYLNSTGRIIKMDEKKNSCPPGTLLIRNYTDNNDLGHVALVIDDCPDSNTRIMHAYPFLEDKNEGGTLCIEDLHKSDNWFNEKGGYYTHFALPECWLCH